MGDAAINLDALLDMLAEKVAEKLAARAPTPADDGGEYYDARTAPCGRRRFLDAAARGSFPSFKLGRRVVARRADVRKWMESRPRNAPPAAAPPANDPDATIDAWQERVARKRRRAAAG